MPDVRPGDVVNALPACAPDEAEPFERIFEDFERIIVPAGTHWNHPRFFAYFATSSAPVAVLAEALVATLDVKAMLWRTSPAATELEEVTMGWLGRLLHVPDAWMGIIYDTASIAGFTALAAARESLDLGIRRDGMTDGTFHRYASTSPNTRIRISKKRRLRWASVNPTSSACRATANFASIRTR